MADMMDFLADGFNAKTYSEGRSWVKPKAALLDESIDIWDDVNDPRSIGVSFDAEGTPKAQRVLVREGVCRALVHDRRTAKRTGTRSSGHAVPGGEVSGPMPTNLFLAGGDQSPEELIADVERGLLVTDFWYTRILDPKTQVVTGLTRNGTFLIEKGKITGRRPQPALHPVLRGGARPRQRPRPGRRRPPVRDVGRLGPRPQPAPGRLELHRRGQGLSPAR